MGDLQVVDNAYACFTACVDIIKLNKITENINRMCQFNYYLLESLLDVFVIYKKSYNLQSSKLNATEITL